MKLFALAAALALAVSPALAQSARVVDGDTLKVDGLTYRLLGNRRARVWPAVRRWTARWQSCHRTLARTDWRTPRFLRAQERRSLRPHRRALPRGWPRPGRRHGDRWPCLGLRPIQSRLRRGRTRGSGGAGRHSRSHVPVRVAVARREPHSTLEVCSAKIIGWRERQPAVEWGYHLLQGTSVRFVLRSRRRHPSRAIGCPRYGGSSSAAVLGTRRIAFSTSRTPAARAPFKPGWRR
jgi:hypothetical protein